MKLFKNTVALLMVLCMLACMSVAGAAVDYHFYSFTIDCEQSPDGKTLSVTVFANNCTGLVSGTIDCTYTGGAKFDRFSVGTEANKVNKIAGNGFYVDVNDTTDDEVICNFRFEDKMWGADAFAENADNENLNINVKDFDIGTFNFRLDGSAYKIYVGISDKYDNGGNCTFSATKIEGDPGKTGTDKLTYSSVINRSMSEDSAIGSLRKGDLNDDGKVGSDDARLALRASVNLERFGKHSVRFYLADVNKDRKLGPDDARRILRVSVNLEAFEPSVGDIDENGRTIVGFDPFTGRAIVGVGKNGNFIFARFYDKFYDGYSENPLDD